MQFQLAFLLAPRLQPGGSSVPTKSETVQTVSRSADFVHHRAKAPVLMRGSGKLHHYLKMPDGKTLLQHPETPITPLERKHFQ